MKQNKTWHNKHTKIKTITQNQIWNETIKQRNTWYNQTMKHKT